MNAIFQHKRLIFQGARLSILSNVAGGTFIPGGTVIPDPRVCNQKLVAVYLESNDFSHFSQTLMFH